MKIQVGKTYQTVSGREVRVATFLEDIDGSYKYVGTSKGNVLSYFNEEGRSVGGNYSLLPKKTLVTKYSFVYTTDVARCCQPVVLFDSKEDRDVRMNAMDKSYGAVPSTVVYEIEED